MKIPKHFQLMGQTYTVRIVRESDWKDPEAVGLFDNATRQILILKADVATMQQVFLHEATHAILLVMGRDELYKDEAFVDLNAGLLHQLLTSME